MDIQITLIQVQTFNIHIDITFLIYMVSEMIFFFLKFIHEITKYLYICFFLCKTALNIYNCLLISYSILLNISDCLMTCFML